MGAAQIPTIALRGPGCISGTGLCDGVLGTGGISCSELLGIIGGRCGNVMGTGGCSSNVLGTGGTRCANNTNNVSGAGGRRNCGCSCNNLKTPTIVPR